MTIPLTPAHQLLDALYAADTTVPLPLFRDGETCGVDILNTHPYDIDASTLTDAGVAFLFVYRPDVERDYYTLSPTPPIPPTAVLYRDGAEIICWALDVFEDADKVAPVARAMGMEGSDDMIPLPPKNGWELIHIDPNAFTTLEALAAQFCEEEESIDDGGISPELADETPPPTENASAELYGDAVVRASYNDQDYHQEVIVTLGAVSTSKSWKPAPQKLGLFISKLCVHKEGSKDGPSYVLADMVPGQRLKVSVKSCTGIGLDIDTGTPSAVVDAALAKLGCLAVRYTTHSHAKTRTEFKKDKVSKFAPGAEIDDELMRRFCTEVEQWDKSIVDSIEYLGTDHTEKGIVAQIKHRPMPKHRVVVPLLTPFEIAKEGKTQKEAMERWAKVPSALSDLLGIPFDKSCVDPSRLFYFPRHAKNRPFEISLFGGPLFDYHTLELDNYADLLIAQVGKSSSKSVTDEGRALGRFSVKRAHGFQIVDVLDANAPDRLRGHASSGYNIECPFDSDHSNAGDSEDRACFAVNAGEGQSEFFTISCRHETCRNKTNLDMLGKMIADGWFGKEVLEDDQFNALLEEGEERAATPVTIAAAKIEKEDEARKDFKIAIDTLSSTPSENEVHAVLSLIAKSELSQVGEKLALERIKKKTKGAVGITVLKIQLNAMKAATKPVVVGAERTGDGKVIFRHGGSFNFDEACDVCADAVEEANEKDGVPTVSVLGREPVKLVTTAGRLSFEIMTSKAMWSYLTRHVSFVISAEHGDSVRDKVPGDVAEHVYEQADAFLRQSPKLVHTPFFLKDGFLLVSPGYHYCEEDPGYMNHLLIRDKHLNVPEVSEHPTREQMVTAREWLLTELFGDFPFVDDGHKNGEPSRAHALAMLITPFMREMVVGRTPVFFIQKPKGGTGGSLLTELPMLLFDGVVLEDTRYSSNDEEMNKALLTSIRSGGSHLFFDNIVDFSSVELHRVTTQEMISGRGLGTNNRISAPNHFNWVANGNNPRLDDQMARRCAMINMNAKTFDVLNRTFRHPNVSGLPYKEFVKEHRGDAIAHILTLIQYWIENGMKPFKARKRVGFENWGERVGGVLQACGVEGFLDGKEVSQVSDQQVSDHAFVQAWQVRFGGDEKSGGDLFEWVMGTTLDYVSGRYEDGKKGAFLENLRRLTGNTFKLKSDDKSEAEYMLDAKTNDMGRVYKLELVRKIEPKI